MRININGESFELRVQERRVTIAEVFKNGKVVAGATAVCAPRDVFDPKEGERVAVVKLTNQIEAAQIKDQQAIRAKYAHLIPPSRITPAIQLQKEIGEKLAKRRERKKDTRPISLVSRTLPPLRRYIQQPAKEPAKTGYLVGTPSLPDRPVPPLTPIQVAEFLKFLFGPPPPAAPTPKSAPWRPSPPIR